MKHILCNKRGEGHIGTGIKIIIAVVIGALILGGIYLLLAGDEGIMNRLNGEVEDMMDYTQELRYERYYDEDTGVYSLRYSYDGKYQDSYRMPKPVTVNGDLTVSDVLLPEGKVRLTYRLTDIYNQAYWTEALNH